MQVFQSHLRPIHPIHRTPILATEPRRLSFNRICAPSTLSTVSEVSLSVSKLEFQSHLRPIHPIHKGGTCEQSSDCKVSIASAPHPPYPLAGDDYAGYYYASVSIASAPHPPYPQKRSQAAQFLVKVSIASAPHPPYPPRLQVSKAGSNVVSIASAPHPPYPRYISRFLE